MAETSAAANCTADRRSSRNSTGIAVFRHASGLASQAVVSCSRARGDSFPSLTAVYNALAASPLLWQEKHLFSAGHAAASRARNSTARCSGFSLRSSARASSLFAMLQHATATRISGTVFMATRRCDAKRFDQLLFYAVAEPRQHSCERSSTQYGLTPQAAISSVAGNSHPADRRATTKIIASPSDRHLMRRHQSATLVIKRPGRPFAVRESK